MRPSQAWLLAAAVGIGIVIGLILYTDSQPDPASQARASTTAGRTAISEFERLRKNRLRALDGWTQALGGPLAAFLPISTKARSEERRIVEQAAALTGSCEAAEEDACRLLDALGDLADSEWVRLGIWNAPSDLAVATTRMPPSEH